MSNEEFKNNSKNNVKDFSRNRKVGFVTLVCMILNMIKKSTQLEIDEFLKRFGEKGTGFTTYTKQSFSEARQKLSPNAFTILNDSLINKFYEDNDFKKYKGYRLLAIDGSYNEIPNNNETRKKYGFVKNNSKELQLARALSSNLYDIENKILISSILGRCDDNERKMAVKNIEKAQNLGHGNIQDLILFDRGYPSIALINSLNSMNVKYLMRISPIFFNETKSTQSKDEHVRIEITKQRARELRRQRTPITAGTVINLRVIIIELENGEIETLITNLDEIELKYRESKDLYFKRWGIETKFDELKNKFEIENFSGEKPVIIEQDFYATILLSNIASVFEQEAQQEIKRDNSKKKLKHEYKINKSVLVGKLKNNLIELLLENNNDKKASTYEQFIKEIKRNIVPVIKNRTFARKKVIRKNKYSKSRRRVL